MKDNMSVKNNITYILEYKLKGKIIDQKNGTYGVVFIVDNRKYYGENVYPRYVAYKTAKKIEPEELAKFRREARKWFKVTGYGLIATPFYITQFENRPYICMPFCEMDLRTYINKKESNKLELIEALIIAAQILKALQFACRRGIESHQDLKPENILFRDQSKHFKNFMEEMKDFHPIIQYKVMVTDFGLANAWKELGKPQGSRPYMAPEQYYPYDYGIFCPDIFALGVIMAEMLTGKHPSGKPTIKAWRNWNETRWQKWAKTGERYIEMENDDISKEVEDLVRNMLSPNPKNRPSLEDAFKQIMSILQRIDTLTTKQLELQFERYDAWSEYSKTQWIDDLVKLSEIPEQLNFIIDELSEELARTQESLNTPKQAVYFCKLAYQTAILFLKRGRKGDNKSAIRLAEEIIEIGQRWRGKITASDKYPQIIIRGKIEVDDAVVFQKTDFDVHAEIISYGKKIMESVVDTQEIEKFFLDKDEHTRSIYYYLVASDYKAKGDYQVALEMSDGFIKLNPSEPILYLFKAECLYWLWKWIEGYDIDKLKSEMLENIDKTLKLDTKSGKNSVILREKVEKLKEAIGFREERGPNLLKDH